MTFKDHIMDALIAPCYISSEWDYCMTRCIKFCQIKMSESDITCTSLPAYKQETLIKKSIKLRRNDGSKELIFCRDRNIWLEIVHCYFHQIQQLKNKLFFISFFLFLFSAFHTQYRLQKLNFWEQQNCAPYPPYTKTTDIMIFQDHILSFSAMIGLFFLKRAYFF